tara:strand:- start:26 stop:340 length:315 start_codon:yes stop_codon:yes gene_type:complete
MNVTINAATRFRIAPDFIISLILICPLPNTTALGGVAIGSIKAQLAAIVVGITKNMGLNSNPIANIIKIGVKVATVAVLEFSSVRKTINKTNTNINKYIFKPFK